VGVETELEGARRRLRADRATEARRQALTLRVHLLASTLVWLVYGSFFLRRDDIPDSLGYVSLMLVVAQLATLIAALRGYLYAAGTLAQVLPILPVLFVASALSVEAGFGSLLFIGALGVAVTIPEKHTRARFISVALLVSAIIVIQAIFTRTRAWAALPVADAATLSTANRTIMTIGLFALAFVLTRSVRVGRDLVEQSLAVADLAANTDPLTGLVNRRPVWDRMEELRAGGETFCVAIVDIDHFKVLNDTYGHTCGDETLRDVAAAIDAAVRDDDLVGRWGGEEFVVVLDASLADALVVMGRVRAQTGATTVPCAIEPLRVTVSVGVAECSNGDPADALRTADAALYRAKANGRDRVES